MMPAVPEFSDSHTHTHTEGMGRGETEAEGDLRQWVAQWPQNKKPLGLRSGFMGRQCVCDDARLNGWASMGFIVFSIKSDCQIVSFLPLFPPWNTKIKKKNISAKNILIKKKKTAWERKVGHQLTRGMEPNMKPLQTYLFKIFLKYFFYNIIVCVEG